MKISTALTILALAAPIGFVHADSKVIKAEEMPKGTVVIKPGQVGGSYLDEADIKQESISKDIKNPRFKKDQKDLKQGTSKSGSADE